MKEEDEFEKRRMKERHIINAQEAAQYLAISPITIRRNQGNGDSSFVRIDRMLLFDMMPSTNLSRGGKSA
jgi:hypothetical protein